MNPAVLQPPHSAHLGLYVYGLGWGRTEFKVEVEVVAAQLKKEKTKAPRFSDGNAASTSGSWEPKPFVGDRPASPGKLFVG
eukprot:COSAG03_NODE_12860_length_527_cov_2.408879_1_plen_80_part_01